MQIVLIRERKMPPDARVALTPAQCLQVQAQFPATLQVELAPDRCFANAEYEAAGIPLTNEPQRADLLLGIKEVPIQALIPEKTYCFFSHTIKKQAYNRDLLRTILDRGIRLIDYEVLTDARGKRLVAFGYFAGMVGAHNALYTYGRRTEAFDLPRMIDCRDYAEAKSIYAHLRLPPVRIVLTGTGRVGQGARQVLLDMGIRQVHPRDFLQQTYSAPVFTQLGVSEYVRRSDGRPFESLDFYQQPENFVSAFTPYAQTADIMINGIFWDNRAPAFFTKAEMRDPAFQIQVIADVTADIAPVASIPSSLRPSSIHRPVYGYDPVAEHEVPPHQPGVIDMMVVDNLPNELPRDASKAFGQQLIRYILPEFFRPQSEVLERATVAIDGRLGKHFQYLQDFVDAAL